MKLKTILVAVMLLVSGAAFADDTSDAVLSVAQSKTSQTVTIFSEPMRAVYVGNFGGCDAVSIFWAGDGIRNYRVCSGQFSERNSVSPAWDAQTGSPTLAGVMADAKNDGVAQQKDQNGYLISAHRLNTAFASRCAKYEVNISYDGDLVSNKIVSDCN